VFVPALAAGVMAAASPCARTAAAAPRRGEIVSPDELGSSPYLARARGRGARPVVQDPEEIPPLDPRHERQPRASRRPRAPPRPPPDPDDETGGRIEPWWAATAALPSPAPSPSPGAPAAPVRREVGLPELIASVLSKNFELAAASHSINAAHRALQFAKSQQLPIATLKTTLLDTNFDKRFRAINDFIPPGAFGNALADTFGDVFDSHALISGITIKVPIYHGDRLAVLPRVARVRETIEIVRRQKLVQDLTLRAIELYVDLLLEQKRLALALQKLAKKEEDLKLDRQRVKSAVELNQKVLATELTIDEIRQEILEIQNDSLLLKERLSRLAGMPRSAELVPVPDVSMKEIELPLDEIVREVRRTNPDIQVRMKAVDLANEQVAIANGKDHTTLDFQFDFYEHFIFRNTRRDAEVYTANLVFAWDVYDGGRNLSEQREAREKRDQSIAELETATQNLETEVRQAHNKLVESRKAVTRANLNIDLARENLRVIQEKVDAKLMLPVDREEARVNLQQALVNRERAQTQATKARARLYGLMGRLTPSVLQ
jgi:outer membrane protein TolC